MQQAVSSEGRQVDYGVGDLITSEVQADLPALKKQLFAKVKQIACHMMHTHLNVFKGYN